MTLPPDEVRLLHIRDATESAAGFIATIPQIAIHGTSLPASELGKDLSNGCVRMPNDVILEIAKITPLLGTPVTITA